MNPWTPMAAWHHPRSGSTAERYVLRLRDGGRFLAVDASGNHLCEVSAPEEAHQFHSHDGAVQRAHALTPVMGRPLDVVRLR